MSDHIVLAVVAMLCITTLEVYAIHMGVNGYLFGLVVAALAGLGGYSVEKILKRWKGG